MTVLLLVLGALWVVVALAAALWVAAAMRRAEQGEQRRLGHERADDTAGTGGDDIRTA